MYKKNNNLKNYIKTPNINVAKTIEKTANETAKAMIEEVKVQNMIRKEFSYCKTVKLLL